MSSMAEGATGGPGLTVSRFFASIPDLELRRFIDPRVLSVLDAIFGGRTAGDDLRRVAHTLVDVSALLGEQEGRRLVLDLVSDPKRIELEARVGRGVDTSRSWTEGEVNRARDFFGLIDERIVPPTPPAVTTIKPSYGLFEH